MKINLQDRKILKKLFKIFLVSRVVLIIFILVADFFLSKNISRYKDVFLLFDNEHYLYIAKNGYMFPKQFAFFPLTPLLIRYLGKVGFLVFNQIWTFLSGYLLYLVADRFYQKEDNTYPATLYFISPISIFTCMFYSEALFLFLTILSFYLYKSKKNYFALGITLGLSVLTRSLGSMLFFTIFLFMFINFVRKKEKLKNIFITFIPALILSCLYPIYLYFKTGDLLYFITVQYNYWGRISSNIFTIFFDSLRLIMDDSWPLYVVDYLLFFGLMFYIFKYIFKYKKEKKYYDIFVYIIFTLISICSTIRCRADVLASFYRYIFGCFPIYFMFKKNYFTFGIILFISIFLSYFFLAGLYFY